MKINLKKILSIVFLISVGVTSLILIGTFLNIYNFYYISDVLNSYLPLQIGIITTMTLLSLWYLLYSKGKGRYTYALLCILIAIGNLYFVYVNVK